MATPESQIIQDLTQVAEGAASVVANSSLDQVPTLPPAEPSKGIFFRFGQCLATVAETLICGACKKAEQKIDAKTAVNPTTSAAPDPALAQVPAQVQSAPKP